MKLNRNSWFYKYYLLGKQDEPWEAPNTICHLARRVTGMTALWGGLAAWLVGAISGAIMFGMIIFGSFVFDDQNVWHQFASIAAIVTTAVGLMFLAVAGYGQYNERRMYKVREPSKLSQFTSGIWARIKDKTCVLIEWED